MPRIEPATHVLEQFSITELRSTLRVLKALRDNEHPVVQRIMDDIFEDHIQIVLSYKEREEALQATSAPSHTVHTAPLYQCCPHA